MPKYWHNDSFFPWFEMKRINCAWTNVLLSVYDQLFTVSLIHSSKKSSSRNSWMVVNGRSHFPRIMPFLFTSIYSKVQRTSIWFFFSRKKDPDAAGKSLCFYLASTFVFSGGAMRRMTKEMLRLFFFFFFRDGSFTKKFIKNLSKKSKISMTWWGAADDSGTLFSKLKQMVKL